MAAATGSLEKAIAVGPVKSSDSASNGVPGRARLASLPSLDVLRGRLIGLLQAPAAQLARVLQAPAGQVARVLAAHAENQAESA